MTGVSDEKLSHFEGREIVKSMKHRAIAATVLAVIMANLTAQADEAADKQPIFTLNKVTVAATLTEEKLEDVASSVSVIDEESINKNGASDIAEMVRYEPGVEVSSTGRFGLAGFNIRGMNENRVKITVDGVEQARAFDTGGPFLRGNRNFVDVDSLKRVEILKGPASSLYGSDALGGVVAFTTKDPADYLDEGDDTALVLKAQYLSKDNSTNETLTLANRSGSVESLLLYTRRDGNETENFGDEYPSGQGAERHLPDPVEFASNNVLAKLYLQLNARHRFGFTAEFFQTEAETELLSLEGPTASATFNYADYSGDDTSTRTRLGFSHEWQSDVVIFDSLVWKLNWQKSESEQETRNFTDFSGWRRRFIDYRNEEENIEFNAQFDKTLGIHNLTYGLRYQSSDFENTTDKFYLDGGIEPDIQRYTPVIEGTSYGFFVQDKITLLNERLLITPGLRYDSFDAQTQTDARYEIEFDDHSSSVVTARLGTVFKFDGINSIFAQYSQGYKAPDIAQLYRQDTASAFRGYIISANPDLDPEESDAFELGLRSEGALGSVELTVFHNEFDQFIESTARPTEFNGSSVIDNQYQNIAEATVKGLELRGALWLDDAFGAPSGSSFQVAMSYADGEGRQSGEDEDTPIDSVSPLTAVFGLNYDDLSEQWGASLNWTLVEAKDRSDISDEADFATSGYGIVDLTAYYQAMRSLTIRGGIFNLGDKEYFQWQNVRGFAEDLSYINRYTEPGRNFSLSVNYQF